MNDVLVIIDMQNDFIDGALGSAQAQAVTARLADFAKAFDGEILFTKDTHNADYLQTQEGKKLPVEHCIRGSRGWEIHSSFKDVRGKVFEKLTFGSLELARYLQEEQRHQPPDSITLSGVCTDICVISNALLLKAFLPETRIVVDASLCAGTSQEGHENALNAMKACQIEILNA